MGNFLNIALTFPPVIYSLLLVVVIVYWLSVLVGVLDLDLFDIDVDMDLDLDVDVDMGGAMEGAVEGASDLSSSSTGMGHRVLVGIFSWLSLGRVPVTISFSFFTLYAWIMTFSGVYYLSSMMSPAMSALLFAGSTILSLFLAGVSVRPMRGLFHTHTKHGQETLVGSVCVVTTGRVDAKFGQASFNDGGAGLNLSIRCDTPDNGIKRGDRVLIIGYDPETRLYHVEPYENLDTRRETELDFDIKLENASSAAQVAANRRGLDTGGKNE